jgi:hypothetical protein
MLAPRRMLFDREQVAKDLLKKDAPVPPELQQIIGGNIDNVYRTVLQNVDGILPGDGETAPLIYVAQRFAFFSVSQNVGQVMEDFVVTLEATGPFAADGRQFYNLSPKGSLRSISGKAVGRGVKVTRAGVNQILGAGIDPINILWRDYLLRCHDVLQRLRRRMDEYIANVATTRKRSVGTNQQTVQVLVDRGVSVVSARSQAQCADRVLYKAVLPGFESAKAAVIDARPDEPNIGRRLTSGSETITSCGTAEFHVTHDFLRIQTDRLVRTGMSLDAAAKAVEKMWYGKLNSVVGVDGNGNLVLADNQQQARICFNHRDAIDSA